MVERSIPLAAMERIMEKAGAERISEDAKHELKRICELLVTKYGERAAKFADHAGRKTVKEEDVKLAIRQGN